jgi:hypothetical protein
LQCAQLYRGVLPIAVLHVFECFYAEDSAVFFEDDNRIRLENFIILLVGIYDLLY